MLDIMFADFPEKYEEFRKHIREKQARELSSKQKGLCLLYYVHSLFILIYNIYIVLILSFLFNSALLVHLIC